MHGEKIKTIRELRDYSQEYMSEKLGIKQNTYSKIENNQTKLNAEMLEKLAEVLKVSVLDIINPKPIIVNFSSASTSSNADGQSLNFYKSLFEKLLTSKDEEIRYLKEIIDYALKDREYLLAQIRK